MKTTKTVKTIEEIAFVCEVCDRRSLSITTIQQCEENHKRCKSNHPYWAKDLHPIVYAEIIDILEASNHQVMIIDIRSEKIGPNYAIVTEGRPGYWLDAYKTKRDCVKLCKELGWKIVRKEK